MLVHKKIYALLRIVGSTIKNDRNLRPLPYHPVHTFLLLHTSDPELTYSGASTIKTHFHNVALTAPFSGRLHKKWGEVRYFFFWKSLVEISVNMCYMRMYVCVLQGTSVGNVNFSFVNISQLFKDR